MSKAERTSVSQASVAEVHQLSTAGIGDVRHVNPSREAPDKERVDVAENQIAAFRPFPGAGNVVENPSDL